MQVRLCDWCEAPLHAKGVSPGSPLAEPTRIEVQVLVHRGADGSTDLRDDQLDLCVPCGHRAMESLSSASNDRRLLLAAEREAKA